MTTKEVKDDLEAVRLVVQALEGFEPTDQRRIIRWASEKLSLDVSKQDAWPAALSVSSGSPTLDIRTFIETKSPRSDTHFAAAIAYYYKFEAPFELRKASIAAEDLQDACRQTGRRRLKSPAQTLINALNSGYLDKAGRGAYQINTVGENLVAMALPGGQQKKK